jgi:hypothetical protein
VDDWIIGVRDVDHNMIGEIDDEQELEIRDRHLSHGAWKIVVDGRTVFSGPTTRMVSEVTDDNAGTDRPDGAETTTFTGISDTSAFRRIIYPRSATPITSTGVKHSVDRTKVTGAAETVIGTLIN